MAAMDWSGLSSKRGQNNGPGPSWVARGRSTPPGFQHPAHFAAGAGPTSASPLRPGDLDHLEFDEGQIATKPAGARDSGSADVALKACNEGVQTLNSLCGALVKRANPHMDILRKVARATIATMQSTQVTKAESGRSLVASSMSSKARSREATRKRAA